MKKIYVLRSVLLTLLLTILSANLIYSSGGDKRKNKVLTNDDYKFIARNEIKMWFSNNGDGSHDPMTDGNGLFWPGGATTEKSAVFEDGLVFGGKIGNEIHCNGNTYRQGLQAGKLLINGQPDDPTLEKYRIYKSYINWQTLPSGPEKDAYQLDYNQWPWQDGAPWVDVNSDSVYTPGVDHPEYIGDEIAWYVANDMDPTRSIFTYGTTPMGIEFQTTVFQFETDLYKDMIFKRYLMINKYHFTVDSMFVGYWADVDLGDAGDDFVGCDTILNIGYTYNADNMDGNGSGNSYGTPPPAIAYDFLQMPKIPGSLTDSAKFMNKWVKGYKNLDMTSFLVLFHGVNPFYPLRDPQQGVPQGSIELYNYLKGLVWSGDSLYDPNTNELTRFTVAGDPVNQTGWYEGPGWSGGPPPSDRRQLMSTGPFTFAPGDTQEVIIGIVLAKGTDNINSITEVKAKDIHMERLYYYNFKPSLVSVKDVQQVPDKFSLLNNYPNPFNPVTVIKYNIPNAGKVSMKVYNVIGREVADLVNEYQQPGTYEIKFDGKDLPSGVYFCRLSSGKQSLIRKMVLIK